MGFSNPVRGERNMLMYIIKNALKSIGRSKGRNILIGIIVLVIAVSACLGLSIRQAAESAKESTLEGLNITASISYDRSSMMSGILGGSGAPEAGQKFDRDQFESLMGSASSLTLEEYQKYAEAESVQDFYYTLTASMNGADELKPVSDDASDDASEDETESESGGGQGFGGFGGMMGFPGGGMGGGMPSDLPAEISGGNNPFEKMFGGATEYITEVNSAMNLTVVLQMLGVGLLLTLVASMASVMFIMRYDPLKILANRD